MGWFSAMRLRRQRDLRRWRSNRIAASLMEAMRMAYEENDPVMQNLMASHAEAVAQRDDAVRRSVTRSSLLATLREALALDRHAVQDVLAHRVSCNADLANHPTTQVLAPVGPNPVAIPPGQWRVGALGLLNAACADPTGRGAIQTRIDADGRIVGFDPYVPPPTLP